MTRMLSGRDVMIAVGEVAQRMPPPGTGEVSPGFVSTLMHAVADEHGIPPFVLVRAFHAMVVAVSQAMQQYKEEQGDA